MHAHRYIHCTIYITKSIQRRIKEINESLRTFGVLGRINRVKNCVASVTLALTVTAETLRWSGVTRRGVAWRGVTWRGVTWRDVAWRGVWRDTWTWHLDVTPVSMACRVISHMWRISWRCHVVYDVTHGNKTRRTACLIRA